MILEQGKIRDEFIEARHERDMKLINANHEEVSKELENIIKEKKAADDVFMGKSELQKLI